MISVLEDEIDGYKDLEVVIDLLPDELVESGEKDFGDPAAMSPERMRSWLREVLGKEG